MGGRFAGKVAIVTGGASGIGAAIAARLAIEGGSVLAVDRKPPAVATDGYVTFHEADLTQPSAVNAMVEQAVKRFGRLDSSSTTPAPAASPNLPNRPTPSGRASSRLTSTR